ncbi:hypothetical protein RH915_05855 [Serpentinicella sp. ANB-PHB4]|uniref:hypothetical protein n=1 Tax=Serpentinicella sp. ANB-PHB4 TaxID=3074076 RepID=UPI00285BD9C6|nr:hypothetical protein [Serpentinicella sp. ANB-PHB4]MDR5659007.1 hypothetical protein [Serpentinicella sp. ANB-PHB4]
MFFVVNWYLGSWLTTNVNNSSTEEQADTPIAETDTTPSDTVSTDPSTEVAPEESDETPSNESESVENITITIPPGTHGLGIARILRDHNLITDVNEFLTTAEDLNLSTQLQSGSFTVSTDSTTEDLVKIISRQMR